MFFKLYSFTVWVAHIIVLHGDHVVEKVDVLDGQIQQLLATQLLLLPKPKKWSLNKKLEYLSLSLF